MNEVISDVFHKLSSTNLSEGSMHWVDVTHINDPHNFYVRLTSLSTFLNTNMIYKLADLQRPDKIDSGDVIVFKKTSRQGENYLRGKIIGTVEDNDTCLYNIFAIDHGFIDSVQSKHIWTSNNIYQQIPPLALCCELDQCQPGQGGKWLNKSIEAMKAYVGKERTKIIVKQNTYHKLIVELINSCPDDIATMLAITGFSTFGYKGPVVNRFECPKPKKEFYSQKNIKIDDKLHVRVQFGKTLEEFFVAETSDYIKYQQQKSEIARCAKFEKNLNGSDLKLNLPVLVTIDHINYERGLIKQIIVPETKALVYFVDLGKSIQVTTLSLKPIPEKLLYPPIAICCCADESQIWENCLHKLLHLGNEFNIRIKKIPNESEPYIVNISHK